MKICVLGSNSFSGFSFINYINKNLKKRNIKIYAFSRSKPKSSKITDLNYNNKNLIFNKGDINKKNELLKIIEVIKSKKIKFIFNFASQSMVGESWDNPLDWYKTNVYSTINLVEKIKDLKIEKFIQFTTPEVYGTIEGEKKETFTFYPSTPYAVSRAASDMHLHILHRFKNFPVIFTRASNVYGNGQDFYRLIPKLFLYAKNKKKFLLHGNGSSVRNFIHIDDVSSALLKILYRGKIGHCYHLSGKNYNSIKEIANKVYSLYKLQPKNYLLFTKDRIAKDKYYKLDSNKIRKELNWNDDIALNQGLNDFKLWFEDLDIDSEKIITEYKHKK